MLDCSPLQWATMSQFPDAPTALRTMPPGTLPVWLALDEISDPVRARRWLPAMCRNARVTRPWSGRRPCAHDHEAVYRGTHYRVNPLLAARCLSGHCLTASASRCSAWGVASPAGLHALCCG